MSSPGLQVSSQVQNGLLDAMESTTGTAPTLDLRTGPPPATCATADSGSSLGSGALPSDWMANASGGTKGKSGTWQVTASANGYVGHFRIKTSTPRTDYQGLVSQAYQNSFAVAVGQQLHVGSNVYKCTTAGTTASSGGGPSGTGTGITDGGAVFDYVGAKCMTMDNTNVANGQVVTVSAFDLTAGNS